MKTLYLISVLGLLIASSFALAVNPYAAPPGVKVVPGAPLTDWAAGAVLGGKVLAREPWAEVDYNYWLKEPWRCKEPYGEDRFYDPCTGLVVYRLEW